MILTGRCNGRFRENLAHRHDNSCPYTFPDSQATFSMSVPGKTYSFSGLPSLTEYIPTPPAHCLDAFLISYTLMATGKIVKWSYALISSTRVPQFSFPSVV